MKALGFILIALLIIIGCGKVSSVKGWDGGLVAAGTFESHAVVRYWAPRSGWTLSVDHATIDGPTATLWLTAKGPLDGPLEQTPIEATWELPATTNIECVQAQIRIDEPAAADRRYRPAATGCGQIAP